MQWCSNGGGGGGGGGGPAPRGGGGGGAFFVFFKNRFPTPTCYYNLSNLFLAFNAFHYPQKRIKWFQCMFCSYFFRTFAPIFHFKFCKFYDGGPRIFLAPGRKVPWLRHWLHGTLYHPSFLDIRLTNLLHFL